MKDIKTVIFDLGGVYFTDGAKHFVRQMKEHYGISEEKTIGIIGGKLGKQYRTAEITPSDFWSTAKSSWGLNVDTNELARIWLDGYVPHVGTVSLINRLKHEGYELLFLSDNAPDRVNYLEDRYKFLSRFKAGVFSHVVKARKPNKKMYTAALALSSHPANQCVYIDDKPHLLEPAKALGMATIPFESPTQTEESLRALGLKF